MQGADEQRPPGIRPVWEPPAQPTGDPVPLPPPTPPPVSLEPPWEVPEREALEPERQEPELEEPGPEEPLWEEPVPEEPVPEEHPPEVPDPDRPVPELDPRLVAGLRAGRDARSRLARLADLEGVPLGATTVLEVLEALPDGWQRRTAVRRLIEAGSLDDVDADAIVRVFGRGADRFAVAARLVDAGLTHVEVVSHALPARAAARLRRRGGAT